MKIEDLIGRKFHTKIDKAKVDIYTIEKVNGFGKVVLSLDGKDFDYKTPEYVLRLINEGTWILVEEDNKTPFYLDEYIHNNDAEKRIEAENPNTKKISELPQSIDWLESVENSAGTWSVLTSEKFGELEKLLNMGQSPKEVDFDIEIQSTMQKIQQLLLVKGKEYRRNNNPYHNFEVAARKKGITPERALDGFLLKHLVSYDDMLNDIEQGVLPKIEVVEEKFNDIICYMIIQKAMILSRLKK